MMVTKSVIQLRNASGLEFTDISTEEYRTYYYADGSSVTITEPQYLNVSKSGGHRVLDGAGVSHYILAGWRRIAWKVREGAPHFVK